MIHDISYDLRNNTLCVDLREVLRSVSVLLLRLAHRTIDANGAEMNKHAMFRFGHICTLVAALLYLQPNDGTAQTVIDGVSTNYGGSDYSLGSKVAYGTLMITNSTLSITHAFLNDAADVRLVDGVAFDLDFADVDMRMTRALTLFCGRMKLEIRTGHSGSIDKIIFRFTALPICTPPFANNR